MLSAAVTGFATGTSLILAIGSQNAFILRQGLKREHVFWLCLFCAVSDAVLITAGVTGFGAIVTRWPGLPVYMAWAGAAFLFFYGATRFRAAWRGGQSMDLAGQTQPLGRSLLIAAAFTWANPHVYLDTLALIGAVSTAFEDQEKLAFGIGAALGSFVFFFSLGFGARLLSPYVRSPRVWVFLDIAIGLVMWWIALGLLFWH